MNCLLVILPAVLTVINLTTRVNSLTSPPSHHRHRHHQQQLFLNQIQPAKSPQPDWSHASQIRSNFKSKLRHLYKPLSHHQFNHHASVAMADVPLPSSLYSSSLTLQSNNNEVLARSTASLSKSNLRNQLNLPFVKSINDQLLNIHANYSCKVPKPKLVYVRSQYSIIGKKYYPPCTILHVCSDDTGCCLNDAYTCAAKSSVQVKMYFYAISLETNQSDIEALDFVNDTECECREINPRPRAIINLPLEPLDTAPRAGGNLVSGHSSSSIFEARGKPLGHQVEQMQGSPWKGELFHSKYEEQLEQFKQLQRALAGKDERVLSGEKNNKTGSPSVTDGLNFDHLTNSKIEQSPLELEPPKESPAVTNYDELIVPLPSSMTSRIMESSSTATAAAAVATTSSTTTSTTTASPSASRNMSPLIQSAVIGATPFTLPMTHQVKSFKSKEFEPGEVSSAQCSHMKCPLPFIAIVERPHSVKCTCDCRTSGDIGCIRIKRGLAKLEASQGRCVRRLECQPPRCEYPGDYDTIQYKCPKKSSDTPIYHPNRFDERD